MLNLKAKIILACFINALFLYGCSHETIDPSSPHGYCRDRFNKELSAHKCNLKLYQENHPDTSNTNKSNSETMIENVNNELKKRNEKAEQ